MCERLSGRANHRLTSTGSASCLTRLSTTPSVVLQRRISSATGANDTTHNDTVSTQSPRAGANNTQTSSSDNLLNACQLRRAELKSSIAHCSRWRRLIADNALGCERVDVQRNRLGEPPAAGDDGVGVAGLDAVRRKTVLRRDETEPARVRRENVLAALAAAHAAQHVGLAALLVQVEQARIVKHRPCALRARSAAAARIAAEFDLGLQSWSSSA
jgi:hypothetical protein